MLRCRRIFIFSGIVTILTPSPRYDETVSSCILTRYKWSRLRKSGLMDRCVYVVQLCLVMVRKSNKTGSRPDLSRQDLLDRDFCNPFFRTCMYVVAAKGLMMLTHHFVLMGIDELQQQ